jgi:cell division protein FtsX
MNIFLLKELVRTLFTSWRPFLCMVGTVAVNAISLLLIGILIAAGSGWGENRLIVLFDPGVSYEQIRQLYSQVREWDAISEVSYIAKGDPRYAQDGVEPERAPAGYLRITVRADTMQAEAALHDLLGVAAVQSYQKGALHTRLTSDDSAKTVAIGLGVGGVLVSLLALWMLVRVLSAAWRGELEILYLSGLPPSAIRWSFFSVAVLCAFVAGVIAIFVAVFTRSLSEVRYWLPELSQPGGIGHISLWMIGLALLVGASAGLVGAWTVRMK